MLSDSSSRNYAGRNKFIILRHKAKGSTYDFSMIDLYGQEQTKTAISGLF